MLVFLLTLVFISVSVACFSFAAAAYAPSSMIGERLRALGGQNVVRRPRVPLRERLEQALDPLSRALPASTSDVSTTRSWLIQAGYRDPRSVSLYFGIRSLLAALGLIGVILSGAAINSPLLLVGMPALGFLLPRFILKRKIRAR